jgi:hypothetical protein
VKRYLTEGAQSRYQRKRAVSKLDPFKPTTTRKTTSDRYSGKAAAGSDRGGRPTFFGDSRPAFFDDH